MVEKLWTIVYSLHNILNINYTLLNIWPIVERLHTLLKPLLIGKKQRERGVSVIYLIKEIEDTESVPKKKSIDSFNLLCSIVCRIHDSEAVYNFSFSLYKKISS